MQVLCHSQNAEKVVLQLTDEDLKNIERARNKIGKPADGPLKTALDKIASALGNANMHEEHSRTYTIAAPVTTARNIVILSCCANASLDPGDWAALIH